MSRPAAPTFLVAILPPDASGESFLGIPSIDRATENLVKWATHGEWEALQREVYAEHFEPVTDGLDLSDDILDELPHESIGVLRVFILEDFFTARFGEQGERNVIDDYLKRRGWRESVPARRYLEALRDSTVSLYEVVDIVPGHSVTVRDLILGGEPVRVEEKRGSPAAAPWDRLAARIVAVHGKNRFTGAILRYRHELSQQLLEVFEKMATEMQGAIRAEADEGHEAAPVTRAVARKVMVRTPHLPTDPLAALDVRRRGASPCARAEAEKHRRRGGAVLRGALPTHRERGAGGIPIPGQAIPGQALRSTGVSGHDRPRRNLARLRIGRITVRPSPFDALDHEVEPVPRWAGAMWHAWRRGEIG